MQLDLGTALALGNLLRSVGISMLKSKAAGRLSSLGEPSDHRRVAASQPCFIASFGLVPGEKEKEGFDAGVMHVSRAPGLPCVL